MPLGYLVLLSNQKIVDITSPELIGMEAAVGPHLCLCLLGLSGEWMCPFREKGHSRMGERAERAGNLADGTLMHQSLASLSLLYCVLLMLNEARLPTPLPTLHCNGPSTA